ncbi:MAG: dehydrogenase [Candidatus Riflebacteria bacterium]|nr:dehydrogenase [Candidatus Riflebacteria bacterium]
MARVFNHQIGRAMKYWYPETRPKRQFSAVFDINKCIACQTCTLACKTTWTSGRGQELMFWNNVESKPFGFYPLGWDVRLLDMLGAQTWNDGIYEGKTIFEASPKGQRSLGFRPEDADYANPNLGEDDSAGAIDKGAFLTNVHTAAWMFYLARICNHCTYPACLASCTRGAIYKRPEDGIVVVDQKRCRGYRDCIAACPYKKTFFNPEGQTTEKCIGCFPKIEGGEQPQCVVSCIGKIRLQSFVSTPDKAREDNPVDYLVHVRKLALPLFPQFGLEPNVYYIPPIHVPEPFLVQMFGPGAGAAVKAYREARQDPIVAGLLTLFGSTQRVLWRFKVENGFAHGYDEKGTQVVRVPVTEPTVVRTAFDETLRIARWNIP